MHFPSCPQPCVRHPSKLHFILFATLSLSLLCSLWEVKAGCIVVAPNWTWQMMALRFYLIHSLSLSYACFGNCSESVCKKTKKSPKKKKRHQHSFTHHVAQQEAHRLSWVFALGYENAFFLDKRALLPGFFRVPFGTRVGTTSCLLARSEPSPYGTHLLMHSDGILGTFGKGGGLCFGSRNSFIFYWSGFFLVGLRRVSILKRTYTTVVG